MHMTRLYTRLAPEDYARLQKLAGEVPLAIFIRNRLLELLDSAEVLPPSSHSAIVEKNSYQ